MHHRISHCQQWKTTENYLHMIDHTRYGERRSYRTNRRAHDKTLQTNITDSIIELNISQQLKASPSITCSDYSKPSVLVPCYVINDQRGNHDYLTIIINRAHTNYYY